MCWVGEPPRREQHGWSSSECVWMLLGDYVACVYLENGRKKTIFPSFHKHKKHDSLATPRDTEKPGMEYFRNDVKIIFERTFQNHEYTFGMTFNTAFWLKSEVTFFVTSKITFFKCQKTTDFQTSHFTIKLCNLFISFHTLISWENIARHHKS